MASESINKILEAEAAANKKTAKARQSCEDRINVASGSAASAVQKKLGEAAVESERERNDYQAKLASYTENAEKECSKKIKEISAAAEKNMSKATNAIIEKYF